MSDNELNVPAFAIPDLTNFTPGEILNSLFSLFGNYEAEGVVRDFFTAWANQDFAQAYNRLASDSPLREGLNRRDWVQSRQTWLNTVQAEQLKFDVVLPIEDEDEDDDDDERFLFEDNVADDYEGEDDEETIQRPIIVSPRQSLITVEQMDEEEDEDDDDESNEPYEVEAFWSLKQGNADAAAPLKEFPTPTATYAESGMRWYWGAFTLVKEEGDWRIQTLIDKGGELLRQPEEELQNQLVALTTRAAELADELEEMDSDEEDDDDDDEDDTKIIEINGGDEDLDEEDDDDDDEDEIDIADLFGGFEESNFTSMTQHLQETFWLTKRAMHYNDAMIARNPEEVTAYALAYEEADTLQDYERAAMYAQLAAERIPDQRGIAWRNFALAQINLANRATPEGEAEESEQAQAYLTRAETALRASLQADDAPLGYILLADTLIRQERELDEAQNLLQQAQKQPLDEQDLTMVENGLGRIAESQGNKELALQHYQRAADASPNFPGIWSQIGSLQRELGLEQAARQSFQRGIQEQPHQTEAYVELAALYSEQNKLEPALELLEEGLELNPDAVDILAALTLVHLQRGDLNTAEEFLDEAEEINPDHSLVQVARTQFDTAKALVRQQARNKGKQRKNKHKRR